MTDVVRLVEHGRVVPEKAPLPFKDYVVAVKRRTVLLLLLSIAATIAAIYLQMHQTHGCGEGRLRSNGAPLYASARVDRNLPAPRLLRAQVQDESAEVQNSSTPCPKNEDLNVMTSLMPWLAVVAWVGFAASLQVDFEGRRKRQRRQRRRSESGSTGSWPPEAPAQKENDRSE